jgi:glycosyltransferase involved in cell wall biosynthesis
MNTMNVGMVSTRFAGTDGVSLESLKWAEVLAESGHRVFWFCGASDRADEISMVVPEAHFDHPANEAISEVVWDSEELDAETAAAIERIRKKLRRDLETFVNQFAIDLIVAQNALTIPMHLPLGLALRDLIEARSIPTIAHHHDFHWERDRFKGKAGAVMLEQAFPPRLPNLVHAVIHRAAAEELERRCGAIGTVVPNVFDFDQATGSPPERLRNLRLDLGYSPKDRIFLQPTRVIPRKGIEHAIELVARLDPLHTRLLVSHESGDEGYDYQRWLIHLAQERQVDLRFATDLVEVRAHSTHRSESDEASVTYTLADFYGIADFVTFPSIQEGFGNAFLETIHFRRNLLINRYPVFQSDIEPLGFDCITMDGEVTPKVVAAVEARLADPDAQAKAATHNLALANEHFGMPVLRERLGTLMAQLSLTLPPGKSAINER